MAIIETTIAILAFLSAASGAALDVPLQLVACDYLGLFGFTVLDVSFSLGQPLRIA
jgi:hypothetical protein